ncbi:MAG: AMP-dependent synthetase [Candidatus Rokuibacteriota bacterium]|nr:MAG: AMP-dependent synthetase [Candidatus Rokubacteria bacterium]
MIVPLTLGDFLERAELVYGHRVAVVDEPTPPGGSLGRLSYAEFAEMSRSLAAALDDLAIAENDRIAIVSPNAARFLISLFGVSVFGRVLVPINFRLNPDEVRYIIEHSGSSVLLVDPEMDDALRQIAVKHRFVLGAATDDRLFLRKGATPRFTVTDENATVSINYTSGTTARPKGVQLTHRNFWLNAVTFGWHLAMTDRDVYLHTLPTFHCNGWGMPYALTAMGVRQVIIRKIDGEEILRRVEAEGVTLFNCAPAVIAAVLDAALTRRQKGIAVPGSGRVRVVIAGAPPPSRTIQRIESELGWEFIQIYGLTETAPLLTINRAPAEWDGLDTGERARRLGRAGVPAVGVRMSVDDEGEVLARSNHVFEGYWNQPDETAKALADGWFHTGDGGAREGAYIAITDRKKDVIITGGENVSSIEVEDCLFQHPAVAEVAVIGVPDEKWGETIKALVVLRPGARATEHDLIEHCRSRMTHYKCPTSVELRDGLDRTATGKLQKFKLREPYWAGRTRRVN